jgi:hypothetical protein
MRREAEASHYIFYPGLAEIIPGHNIMKW